MSAKTEHTSVSTTASVGGDTTATKTEKPIESDKTTTTTVVRPTTPQAPSVTPLALASPAYPKMAARPADGYGDGYDEWKADVRAQRAQAEGHTDGMTAYYADTLAQFLSGEAGENRVYSPLNVYLALSMLAETAEGNSRKQILDLLGAAIAGDDGNQRLMGSKVCRDHDELGRRTGYIHHAAAPEAFRRQQLAEVLCRLAGFKAEGGKIAPVVDKLADAFGGGKGDSRNSCCEVLQHRTTHACLHAVLLQKLGSFPASSIQVKHQITII